MVIIDIGCGAHRDPRAEVGMDFYPYAGPTGPTIVHDVTSFPWPIPDGTFDGAVSHQCIEHLPVDDSVAGDDLLFRFFDEVHRILRPTGIFEFDVPHVDGPDAFGDPTHRRFFTGGSFDFLWNPERDSLYPRKIWTLGSLRLDRAYHFGPVTHYHLRKHVPSVYGVLVRIGLGRPHIIHISLIRP